MYSVAVLMSVYSKDKFLYVKRAVESILLQEDCNVSLYIYLDGDVSNQVSVYLDDLYARNDIYLYKGSKNKGLATRLNQLIEISMEGEYEFFARMDADDISFPNRLFRQCSFLSNNDYVDIVGSSIVEIDKNDVKLFTKRMESEHSLLKKNLVTNCPLCHPTVVFTRRIFESVENRYPSHLKNTQDYYLWVDLMSKGYVFSNIEDPLLYFRVDDDFHSRRGLKKVINEVKSRFYAINRMNYHSFRNYLYILCLIALRLSPVHLKKFAYKHLR
ncbi:glycosyltransferase [Vibrio sp. Vb1554]|uniref:glycosyltransferase n=1 Tax=Vibrio sp. Vb1554 TaxID=3074642 RepID=UPI002966B667|nr:glycosyltransferase [Vibrio sp. Vb1554]MDW3048532.1 glycosyltransferase [Vibrio sp. Vb1554]